MTHAAAPVRSRGHPIGGAFTVARTGLVAAALALAGCVAPARMDLPPALQSGAETLPIAGIGGGQSGSFALAGGGGTFARSDTRLALLDPLYESRGGIARFTLAGPEVRGTLAAECTVRERTLTVGIVSAPASPMALVCDIARDGRPGAGRLELQAVTAGMETRDERAGAIALDGVRLDLRSVNRVAGSPLPLETPIGYVFSVQGRPIGAVETNGTPVVTLAPGLDPATREAALAAAVALGVFWDPADSLLGR